MANVKNSIDKTCQSIGTWTSRKELNIYEIKQMLVSLKTKLKNLPDDQENMRMVVTDKKEIDFSIDS